MKSAMNKKFAWNLAVTSAVMAGGFHIQIHTAAAGSATDWVKGNHASSRLVVDTASWVKHKPGIVAGIHITLDDGWKTYWRNPGDAGLPPNFDWSGSANLKKAQLLWPAPVRFHDSAGTSYGYKKEVVFPVLVEPVDATKPVQLKLNMEYAVCADICIPVEAELEVTSGKSGFFSGSHTTLLEDYLGRVPVKITPGTQGSIGIARAQAKLTGNSPVLIFDARFPDGASKPDLFVEGPAGYYLPSAKRISKQGNGTIRYQINLAKGDDPKGLQGQSLTLTLVSEKGQAELDWRVE